MSISGGKVTSGQNSCQEKNEKKWDLNFRPVGKEKGAFIICSAPDD
jgi:hypothetical protein